MKPFFLLATVVALGLPAAAQAAELDTAPGRVVIRVDDGSVQRNVDAGGTNQALALPDGSALLFGSRRGQSGRPVRREDRAQRGAGHRRSAAAGC